MPKSKRDKKVSLTKTGKKGMDLKQRIVEQIRKCLEEFDNLYVFTCHNMRNAPLKEVREAWKGSRFVHAKTRVMALALGRDEASEAQKNVHIVAGHLKGQCGLLFTNKSKNYVLEWFQNFKQMDYAKAGFVAVRTVTLPAAPLPEFSHSIEPHLRALGLPTQLEKGIIMLREVYTVCTEGETLRPEQASVLKLLGEKMAEFTISLLCKWSKDGSFEKFKVVKPLKYKMSKGLETNTKEEVLKETTKKKKRKSSTKNVENNELVLVNECQTAMDVDQSEDVNIAGAKSQLHESQDEASPSTNSTSEETHSFEEVEKPKKLKTPKSSKHINEDIIDKILVDEDIEENSISNKSPKFDKAHPRRSMRTPKPIKRTPEQKRMSLKKISTHSKISKGTPKKSKVEA